MNINVVFRLWALAAVFGSISAFAALLQGTDGLIALVVGCAGGLMATELRKSDILKEWERTGIPGNPKTLQQQELWERGRKRRQRNQNLGVLVGLLIFAVLRSFVEPSIIIIVPSGGLAIYFLCYGWFVHKRLEERKLDL